MAVVAHEEHFDAVVAGAGVAGCAAAAALSAAGLSVLVVEPGLHAHRRLSGELLHPLGLAGLRKLGFVLPPAGNGSAAIQGFRVLHERDGHAAPTMLFYPGQEAAGLAIDHGALRATLSEQLRAMPGVTLLTEARVCDLDMADRDTPVAVLRRDDRTTRVHTGMIVAADGMSSPLRAKAGMRCRRRQLSMLLGVTVAADALPEPAFGHLFLASPRPVLAYPTSAESARVMFDLPLECADARQACLAKAIAQLPDVLRGAVEATGLENGLRSISHDMVVDTVIRGRVLLVGDAAGTCHPLTATGMTMAVTDALRLRAALVAYPRRPQRALALYRRQRHAAQRTRRLVATSLYEACNATAPGALLMRRGLMRYWQSDARARDASMALLAMTDLRLASAVREMLSVAFHGAAAAAKSGDSRTAAPPFSKPRLVLDIAGLVARHMQAALWAR